MVFILLNNEIVFSEYLNADHLETFQRFVNKLLGKLTHCYKGTMVMFQLILAFIPK